MIDEKDKLIIDALRQNARLSTKQIAKKANIPITTVFNRIRNLEKNGIIKGYSCVIDNKKLGKGISAHILININFDKLSKKMMNESDNYAMAGIRSAKKTLEDEEHEGQCEYRRNAIFNLDSALLWLDMKKEHAKESINPE